MRSPSFGARTIAPGRSEPAPAATLLDAQRVYLRAVQTAVHPYADRVLTDPIERAITDTTVRAPPDYALGAFLEYAIPGEHARQHGG
jgi:hypothetical protein